MSTEAQFLCLDNVFVCCKCDTHLTAKEHIVSKQFQGKLGVAYLMEKACNVDLKDPEVVTLMTGKHTTSEVSCKGCHTYLGWKYVHAEHSSNFYKINKFVLEKGAMKMVEFTKED